MFMQSIARPTISRNGWLNAISIGVILFVFGVSVEAQNIDTFNVGSGVPADNNAEPLANYTTPINATNFFNDTGSIFDYENTPSSFNWLNALYQGWHNTQNFTNYGEMDAATGFRFDTQNSITHVEANSFYNVGNINCGLSSLAVLLNQLVIGNNVIFTGYGGIYVSATNVFNSGTIAVGANGLAKFSGDNIDFNRGAVFIEPQTVFFNNFNNSSPNLSATGQTDYNTNSWSPSSALSSTFAYGLMDTTPYELFLNNSVPYLDIRNSDNTGTNLIVRMIFLQDNSVNVATNVYFVGSQGNGFAHVEWIGSYTDPATGQSANRYLYLDDDYVQGSATNILSYGDPGSGVPANYTFIVSDTQRTLGAAATNEFVVGLIPDGNITNNIYSYVNAQFIATTVSTNTSYGPIAITNLPGRVEINAAKTLNLSLASVSGMNYLLLKSTNQYNYDGRSQIAAPYSDIYLGRTNGNTTITNLIQSSIPQWSGTVQAWNTRFTNSFNGTNYDFRILLVASQLNPASAAKVQDFVLYSSNNVVISDTLNVMRTLSINCTNLLITTNGTGNGASSIEGALNFSSATLSWATALPRLACLTNNGAINTLNLSTFGSAISPYLNLFNSGSISNGGGSTVYARNFENYGFLSAGAGSLNVQSLMTTMTNGVISAAGTFSDSASNLIISRTAITVGKSMTLTATNLLTDNGVFSSNFWSVGTAYSGYGTWTGLVLPIKPALGDLLGTTISAVAVTNMTAPGGTLMNCTWSGQDRGSSVAGFSNNVAIGQLILDVQGPAPHTGFYFTGTGSNNAIYVDRLVLLDFAGYTNRVDTNILTLSFNTNLVIYYAQALTGDGISVADKINGFNGNHLRWVPAYAGYFSSTNLVYPDGTTNAVNAALARSTTLDTNGDGNHNSTDPTPIFVPSQVQFMLFLTNSQVKIQWTTIPRATNYIYFATNLMSPNWLPFTNFNNYYYGANLSFTNVGRLNYFTSPQPYPSSATNVWIFDAVTSMPRFYRVMVLPVYP